jgi:SAM-dependent methyltransferase
LAEAVSEDRSGVWRLLTNPMVYEAVQHLAGARRWLRRFARDTIAARPGDCVLDIGCGPGALLKYLPHVTYIGLDRNESYIAQARREYGSAGHFLCDDVANFGQHGFPLADVAVAIGLLHHLDDDLSRKLLSEVVATLKPGGRLITADPCFHPKQSPIIKFVVAHDRGQNVRTFDRYGELVSSVFPQTRMSLESSNFQFPHAVCVFEATRQ